MLARGETDAARERIARLHTGCITLGLDGAAEGFEALAPGGEDGDGVHLALADAIRSVMAQADSIKRSQPQS